MSLNSTSRSPIHRSDLFQVRHLSGARVAPYSYSNPTQLLAANFRRHFLPPNSYGSTQPATALTHSQRNPQLYIVSLSRKRERARERAPRLRC